MERWKKIVVFLICMAVVVGNVLTVNAQEISNGDSIVIGEKSDISDETNSALENQTSLDTEPQSQSDNVTEKENEEQMFGDAAFDTKIPEARAGGYGDFNVDGCPIYIDDGNVSIQFNQETSIITERAYKFACEKTESGKRLRIDQYTRNYQQKIIPKIVFAEAKRKNFEVFMYDLGDDDITIKPEAINNTNLDFCPAYESAYDPSIIDEKLSGRIDESIIARVVKFKQKVFPGTISLHLHSYKEWGKHLYVYLYDENSGKLQKVAESKEYICEPPFRHGITTDLSYGGSYIFTTKELAPELTVPVLNPVENLQIKSAGKESVELTWNASKYAEGYLVYAQKNGTYGYCGMTTTGTSFTDTKALDTNYNFYWVFPYVKDSTGKMYPGGCAKYVFAKGVTPAVANLKASSQTGGVKLTWTKSVGAEGYLIYGKTATGAYGYKGMTTLGTTFTDKKASKTEYNFYWVYPYHRDSKGKMIVGGTPKYVYGKAK